MQGGYDLILAGGHILDPAQGLDMRGDIAVADGRIAAIGPSIGPSTGQSLARGDSGERIDVSGDLVLPGLIDTHAHIFEHVSGRFGLNPDLAGVRSGVTTLVDQGGPSCMTMPAFRRYIAEPSASRALAFISAYVVGGLEGHYYTELYSPRGVDVDATVKAARANGDLVRGIKAHAEIGGFARWGIAVIRLAKEISRRARIPLYIHFGQLWPLPETGAGGIDADAILPEVVPLLEPGDILAHPFTRHPGGFVDKSGALHGIVREALDRGLKVDVGHGSHFSFDMARRVLDAGVLPDTLGADMHGYNTPVPGAADGDGDGAGSAGDGGNGAADSGAGDHPFAGGTRFGLCHAMTEMLALGVPLDHVVRMVTGNAAAMLGMRDRIGALAVGREADITVLADDRGRWRLSDNDGNEVIAHRLLTPRFCLRAGRRFDADAPILPVAEAA